VIAAVVGAALIGVGALVFALKPSSTPAAPAPAAAAATPAAAKPAAPAANTAPAVPAAAAPAAAPAEAPAPAAAEATPAADTPKPSRRRRRADGDEAKADPLHRAIPVPAEQTPTPGDLKAFPSN